MCYNYFHYKIQTSVINSMHIKHKTILLFYIMILIYGMIPYYTVLYGMIPYYTILYYTILYYTILYYTILFYVILYKFQFYISKLDKQITKIKKGNHRKL